MASDTVPAAASSPDDPPQTAPRPNWLASALAPVDPARPELNPAGFHINPALAGDDPMARYNAEWLAEATGATGVSSADYHHSTADNQNTQNGSAQNRAGNSQERSVIRAWLLAGAERWRKGGDARNKRLDVEKARAQANQVKTSQTVNRSEKIVGGSTNNGTDTRNAQAKSLDSKTRNAGSSGGSSGRGGSSGGSGGGSGSDGGGRGNRGSSGGGHRSAPNRGHGSAGHGSGSGGGSRGPGGSGGSGGGRSGNGPQGPRPGGGPGSSGSASAGSGSGGSRGNNASTRPPSASTHTPGGAPGSRPWRNTTTGGPRTPNGPTSPAQGPAGATGGPSGHVGNGARQGGQPGAPGGTPNSPGTGPSSGNGVNLRKTPTPPRGNQPPNQPQTGNTPPSGRPLNTRPSRETGYRDGTRAARGAAHVKAYRDGFKDGWTDTSEAANRQKVSLDKAHTARKQHNAQQTPPHPNVPPKPTKPPRVPPKPTTPPNVPPQPPQTQPKTQQTPQPKQVPPMPTHAPSTPAQPIQVTSVTPTTVALGQGADRPAISHGEVRTLKGFERKLRVKTDEMGRIAEGARALKAHAERQLKHITWLTEQAQIVEGGDKLIGALRQLEEAAKVQAGLAEDIHRRALRAVDGCKALLANVETRYAPIYKAVVDSGLVAPAHMHYYKDTVNA